MTSSEAQHEQQSPATAEGGQQNSEGRNRRRRRRGGRRPGEARQDGQEVTQSEQPQREADNTPAETSENAQPQADGERRGRNRRRNRRGRGNETSDEAGSGAAQDAPTTDAGAESAPTQKAPQTQQQRPRQGQQQQQSKKQQDQPKKERPPRGSVLNRRQTRGDYDDAPKAKEEAPSYVPVVAATVDSYVSQHKGWQRDVLTTLRSLIKNAVPDIEESIMWSQPVFSSNGPVCFIKAYAEAVHFGFWRGTELDDSEGILTGDLTKMRHVAIKSAKEIKVELFEAMVRQAAKLNRDKGDPTLS